MNILFRHGPYDGHRKFLLIPQHLLLVGNSQMIIYQYVKTEKVSEGCIVYQYLGILQEAEKVIA